MESALPVGRVLGHRGNQGALTVRVWSGDASAWVGLRALRIGERRIPVLESSAYRDRLVVRLEGVEDGNAAAAFRGERVAADRADAPPVPEGRHHRTDLVGMRVEDDERGAVGTVSDVFPGGAHELLAVATPRRSEVLIPFVDAIVHEVDETARVVRVRLPDGLLELNDGV